MDLQNYFTPYVIVIVAFTDNQLPKISNLPQDTVLKSASCESQFIGTCIYNWQDTMPFDNSGFVTLTSNYQSGDSFPVGVTTVTLDVFDPYNNRDVVAFKVNVTGVFAYTFCYVFFQLLEEVLEN